MPFVYNTQGGETIGNNTGQKVPENRKMRGRMPDGVQGYQRAPGLAGDLQRNQNAVSEAQSLQLDA